MSPDSRQHRGAHPSDAQLFAEEKLPVLRTATAELSWLLSRGYTMTSSLKLVGDHHSLCKRQRIALARAASSDQRRNARLAKCLPVDSIKDQDVIIDGFNLLITIEMALADGIILVGRDGCFRDLASVHGTYRSVAETQPAICLIGEMLEALNPHSVEWLLDKPVSNSGRLAQKIRDAAEKHKWPWEVDVVFNPDNAIIASEKIAVSSDSSILDNVSRWVNFSAYVIAERLPQAWIVALGMEFDWTS